MESVEKIHLANGVQGKVFLVKTGDNLDEKSILKVIECPDINYANKLFRQLMKIKEIEHKGILVPDDVYVSWEDSTSSVNVNILYPFFEEPFNLDQLISYHSSTESSFVTETIHKIVGDIINALQHLKSCGFLHLNLKLSNVVECSGNYLIADFGLPALLSDIATRTRTTEGHLYKYTENDCLYRIVEEPLDLHKYYPSEVKDDDHGFKHFDDRTDVYSLGLLIYQLYFMTKDVNCDICEWREHALVEMEDPILKGLFLQMTDPDHSTRPSIDSLVLLPEVQHLMEVAEKERIAMKRKKSAAVPHKLVPVDSTIDVVIDNLGQALKSEELTRASFRAVYAFTAKPSNAAALNNDQKKILIDSAQFHEEVQDIQEKFLAIAYNIVPTVEDEDGDWFCDVITCNHITNVIKRYSQHENIIYACLQVLLSISAHKFGTVNICKGQNTLNTLVEFLVIDTKYPGDRIVAVRLVLWILWGIVSFVDNAKYILPVSVPSSVYSLKNLAKSEESLLEPYTACLWSLSNYKETLDEFKKIFGIDYLIQVIHDFQQEPRILRNCCMALANYVEMDEVCAYTIMAASNVDDPFQVLRNIYQPNRDNPEFVESYVTLLAEVSAYDELRFELHRLNFGELCKEISLFYGSSSEIVKNNKRTIANLEAYKLDLGKNLKPTSLK